MRVGVFFCEIEGNKDLNIDSIAKYAANLPNVDTVEVLGIKPRLDVQILYEIIKANNLGRIVIAGDMPGYFKPRLQAHRGRCRSRPDPTKLEIVDEVVGTGAGGEDGR